MIFKTYVSSIKVLATDLDDPDTDENGLVTYSLASGQEFFKIDPHTGLISARVTLERGIWKADVVAEDGGGLTGSTRLVVNVGEVEERVVVRDVNNFDEVEELSVNNFVEEEEERSERRKRFLTEQQIRLDTLDSYCSSRKQWPGVNSNVIYVLQVVKIVGVISYSIVNTTITNFLTICIIIILFMIVFRSASLCGALCTRQPPPTGCTTSSSWPAGSLCFHSKSSSKVPNVI